MEESWDIPDVDASTRIAMQEAQSEIARLQPQMEIATREIERMRPEIERATREAEAAAPAIAYANREIELVRPEMERAMKELCEQQKLMKKDNLRMQRDFREQRLQLEKKLKNELRGEWTEI